MCEDAITFGSIPFLIFVVGEVCQDGHPYQGLPFALLLFGNGTTVVCFSGPKDSPSSLGICTDCVCARDALRPGIMKQWNSRIVE